MSKRARRLYDKESGGEAALPVNKLPRTSETNILSTQLRPSSGLHSFVGFARGASGAVDDPRYLSLPSSMAEIRVNQQPEFELHSSNDSEHNAADDITGAMVGISSKGKISGTVAVASQQCRLEKLEPDSPRSRPSFMPLHMSEHDSSHRTSTDRPSSLYSDEVFHGRGISESQFQRLRKIGEGTYGIVYKARDKKTDDLVALKYIRCDTDDEEGLPGTALREVMALRGLKHPNIVRLHHVICEKSTLCLVFEFLSGDLRKFLDDCKARDATPTTLAQDVGLPTEHVKSLMYQLLSATAYMHSSRIIHRDLKPQNILLNDEGTLKIADFGLARAYSAGKRAYTHEVVTMWYRAPEILLGATNYTSAVDMWSLGCIFAELLSFEPLWSGNSEIDQLFMIFETLGTPSEQQWPGSSGLRHWSAAFPQFRRRGLSSKLRHINHAALDLLEKMLKLDPAERISAADALNHPFFAWEEVPQTHAIVSPLPSRTDAERRLAREGDTVERDSTKCQDCKVEDLESPSIAVSLSDRFVQDEE